MTRTTPWLFAALALSACEVEVIPDRDKDTDNGIDCADPIHDLTFTFAGVVHDDSDMAVAGAWVELRDVAPGQSDVFGGVETGADGSFSLQAEGVVWWPDCSALFTDYEIVVTRGEQQANRDVNFPMFKVLYDDVRTVDIEDSPITLAD